MGSQIPAYIMVPSDGEPVLCWGVDASGQPFSELLGGRIEGQWILVDKSVALGIVMAWQYPDWKTGNALQNPGSDSR